MKRPTLVRWLLLASGTAGTLSGCLASPHAPAPREIDTIQQALGCEIETTQRVSVRTDGAQAPGGTHPNNPAAISGTGRYLAFLSDRFREPDPVPGFAELVLHDRASGISEEISVSTSGASGNRESFNPTISADGRYVAWDGTSTNLVSPPIAESSRHIFLRDRVARTTSLISVGPTGARLLGANKPVMSADGRFVAFEGSASTTSMQRIYLWDRQTNRANIVSLNSSGAAVAAFAAAISANGNRVAFRTLEEGIFVRDRAAGTTTPVSVDSAGNLASTIIAGPRISGNGRYVVFSTTSRLTSNDMNDDTDVYVRDLQNRTTTLVSVAAAGGAGDSTSDDPDINDDGSIIVFQSEASNLLPGPAREVSGIYRRRMPSGPTERVSVKQDGSDAAGNTAVVSRDGKQVAYVSFMEDLVPDDTNDFPDLFVRDFGPSTPEWAANSGYKLGDLVLGKLGGLYECLVPGVGWCDTREPGVSLGWEQAWKPLRQCYIVETYELSLLGLDSDGAARLCSGGFVNLTATVSNDGPAETPAELEVGFFHAQTAYGTGTLLGKVPVPPLEPGETATVTFRWNNPPPTAALVRAMVDPDDDYIELDEADNVRGPQWLHTCH
jgi:Tol biopolymer transport system component